MQKISRALKYIKVLIESTIGIHSIASRVARLHKLVM
jgi:hypothetical protein